MKNYLSIKSLFIVLLFCIAMNAFGQERDGTPVLPEKPQKETKAAKHTVHPTTFSSVKEKEEKIARMEALIEKKLQSGISEEELQRYRKALEVYQNAHIKE